MLDYTVLFSLLALGMYPACSGGIVFEGDLSATLGLSASLSCSLPGVGGIKQVTWQHRDPAGSVHAVITLSESLEQLVGEQYAGKVQLAADSLNATTLLIRNITFAEEGCYTCKFYVYPSGTVRETSCLMCLCPYTMPVLLLCMCSYTVPVLLLCLCPYTMPVLLLCMCSYTVLLFYIFLIVIIFIVLICIYLYFTVLLLNMVKHRSVWPVIIVTVPYT
ncbi:OX-2 membrane glycoprotein-like isoform X1 [Astyanax mexicanus]|uniref:OX-2 membrane glycoprotein-like isoform X1 n=1 Tax=Astyanax mexicanus TaxID=7994 RepID=A0A8T2KW60_ASTMX|nr:OX-2 membrane glycoprotein-like isoform X1 [Astyanax mexicanus]